MCTRVLERERQRKVRRSMRERNIETEEGELERAREFEKAENLKARVTAINDVEAKKQLLRMKIKSPMNCRISQRLTMKRKLFFCYKRKKERNPMEKISFNMFLVFNLHIYIFFPWLIHHSLQGVADVIVVTAVIFVVIAIFAVGLR